MSNVVYLSNARLSFPHLVEAQVDKSGRGSFNCDLIFPPDSPEFAKFMKLVGEMALGKWKEHTDAVMQMINSDRRQRCFGKGDEKVSKKTFKPYDGYEGNVYVTARRDTAPQLIKADGTPVEASNTMEYQALARKMYGGCLVNVALKPWVQANSHGNGIRCELMAIQFAADGQAFGEAAPDVSGGFGQVAAPAAPAGSGVPSFFS